MASRNIKDLDIRLQRAFSESLEIWQSVYPDLPQPFLTQTYRSNAEQEALFAQGRQPLAVINELRKKANLLPITITEAKKKVTNAKPGQSKHNSTPARAFDIAFINSLKKIDWSPKLFEKFYSIVQKVDNEVIWGGTFRSIKDRPHFEI